MGAVPGHIPSQGHLGNISVDSAPGHLAYNAGSTSRYDIGDAVKHDIPHLCLVLSIAGRPLFLPHAL